MSFLSSAKFRRVALITFAAVGALLLAAVLYLAFGDLSRHKGRIEALVTDLLGRPFAIDGAFELEVLPAVSVVAQRVRLGNADWGSQPQMVEVGRVSGEIGLWSLVSGPVDVHSFELNDVSVLLETNADGKGNWVMGKPPAKVEEPADEGEVKVPCVVRVGKVGNVRVTYREPGKPDRVALVETLTIGPGSDGLLAVSGKGSLNELPVSVGGGLGPRGALSAGRNIRAALKATVGALQVDVHGGIGRLDPLDGADLTLKLAHPDIGTMLERLYLPVVAAGPLSADVRLKDAGDLTRLDLTAQLGDIKAKVEGTLRALGLPGSDLRIEASVPDVARLAAAFDVTGLPAGALQVGGRFASSPTEIKLDGLSAKFAGATALGNGTVRRARDPGADLRFELAAESLGKLLQGLPEIPLALSGNYTGQGDKLEVKDLKGRIGESEISGQASLVGTERKRVDVELASPRLDLTPFLAQETDAKAADDVPAKPKAKPKKEKVKFVLDDTPLPLDKLGTTDAKLHLALAELKLGAEVLREVDGLLRLEGGSLAFDGRALDSLGGIIGGTVKLAPADGGMAELDLSVSAQGVHLRLDEIDPKEAPTTNLEVKLRTKGASARQMASLADGRILVTQGPGKLKSGLIGLFGGDLVRELVGKLNPFAAKDPYTTLECSVALVDIVGGQATIKPVLVQSEKVTIVADGTIDLGTEGLAFSFNTRPRTGVGVSAGMFTNPFIELGGTLANPKVGVGGKGVVSGAAAAATGGVSVVAQGLVDRAKGIQDLCKETLEEVTIAGKAK